MKDKLRGGVPPTLTDRAQAYRDAKASGDWRAIENTRGCLLGALKADALEAILLDSRDDVLSLLAVIDNGDLLEIATAAASLRHLIAGAP